MTCESPRTKDAATYTGRRLLLWAIPQTIIGVFCAGATMILGSMYFYSQMRSGLAEWYYPTVLILPLLLSHYIFCGGVRLWRSALEKNFWLRADTQNVSWRLPGNPRWKGMGMSYDIDERNIPWKNVDGVHLIYYVNGYYGYHAAPPDLLIYGQGLRKKFDGIYFRESAETILRRINAARSPQPPPAA